MRLARFFEAFREGELTMNVFRAVRAGDDLAVPSDDSSWVGKAADGSPFEMKHKAMEIVRHQADDTSRFVIDDPYALG